METWLIFRILGGLSFSLAHRCIVRRAWRESPAWGLSAMLVPGLSLLFAYRYRADLARPLCAQIAGLLLVATGFGMAFSHSSMHLASATKMTAPLPEATAPAAPAAVAAATPANAPAAEELRREEPAKSAPATEAPKVAAAAPVSAERLPAPVTGPEGGLHAWFESLEARRKQLNVSDPDAVRKFNEEAVRYQAARDGIKPLRDELKPLHDELRPLAGVR